MSEPVRERTIDFSNEARTRVRAKGYEGAIRYGESGTYPGVRFTTWEFEDIDGSICDGALLFLSEKTPPQLVESETSFYEVPKDGDLIFVSVDPDNNVFAYRFRGDRVKDKSFQFEVGKGWIMRWFSVKGKEQESEVIEYEEPGFSQSKLTNINEDQKEINGRKIPDEFWQLKNQILQGQLENTVVPIIELGDL